MKAALCFVVLGQKDRMVLAKAVGIEDQDKTWLPAACAWTLNQDSGLMVVENMETDDRCVWVYQCVLQPGFAPEFEALFWRQLLLSKATNLAKTVGYTIRNFC